MKRDDLLNAIEDLTGHESQDDLMKAIGELLAGHYGIEDWASRIQQVKSLASEASDDLY